MFASLAPVSPPTTEDVADTSQVSSVPPLDPETEPDIPCAMTMETRRLTCHSTDSEDVLKDH